MPPISMKKILIAILIIVLLSRLDRVFAFLSRIYEFVYESLDPARNFSKGEKYILCLLLLALLYITIYKLLYEKMRK
jgi:hypothetical protein